MFANQPTATGGSAPTYWQAPPVSGPESQVFAGLRVRLVGLVAAMVVQATIALLGVLPDVPSVSVVADASESFYYFASQPLSFWVQFAVIELIAALVISLSFGPGVRLSDVPVVGRLVLGLGFVAIPAFAVVLGAIDVAQAAAEASPAAAASGWLTVAFFGTLFFGLPLIALMAHASRVGREPAGPLPA